MVIFTLCFWSWTDHKPTKSEVLVDVVICCVDSPISATINKKWTYEYACTVPIRSNPPNLPQSSRLINTPLPPQLPHQGPVSRVKQRGWFFLIYALSRETIWRNSLFGSRWLRRFGRLGNVPSVEMKGIPHNCNFPWPPYCGTLCHHCRSSHHTEDIGSILI